MTFRPEGWLLLSTFAIESFGVIKLIDLVLSVKKGLAVIVIVFAAANAALVLIVGSTYHTTISAICSSRNFNAIIQDNIFNVVCTSINLTLYVVAACVFVLTIVVYFHEFFRGITDVGFVGATPTCRTQTSPRNLSVACSYNAVQVAVGSIASVWRLDQY
jgi:hypothetical protein